MRSYNAQIADILKSDPVLAADGEHLSGTPLLGTLVGSAPDPGEQDARSWSGLASGGIYTRPPKPWDPRDNRGATPVAFSALSGIIKPCLAVMQESAIRHPQAERILRAQIVSIAVWIYGPAHDSGKTVMEAIRYRVDQLLDTLIFTTDQGPVATINWNFALGATDNPREFAGSRVDMVRYYITTLRRQEPD